MTLLTLQVYAYLRRLGYAVLRVHTEHILDTGQPKPSGLHANFLNMLLAACFRSLCSLPSVIARTSLRVICSMLPVANQYLPLPGARRRLLAKVHATRTLLASATWRTYGTLTQRAYFRLGLIIARAIPADQLFSALQIIPAGHELACVNRSALSDLPEIFFNVYKPVTKIRKIKPSRA